MQVDHRPLQIVSLIARAFDNCLLAIANSKIIDEVTWRELEVTGVAEIFVSYQTYGSTAGPRGGIGGQALTSFPQIVLVFKDYEVVYVYTGGVEGVYKLTAPLYEDIRSLVKMNPRQYKPREA